MAVSSHVVAYDRLVIDHEFKLRRMTNAMPNADALIEMLTEGEAFVGVDRRSRNPYIYLGVGEERFYIKKVQVYNEESGKTDSRWIKAPAKNAGVAKDADPALVAAYKEMIADGSIKAPVA